MNLDRNVFEDYKGPVKCFSCSTMELRAIRGFVDSITPLEILQQDMVGTGESRCRKKAPGEHESTVGKLPGH